MALDVETRGLLKDNFNTALETASSDEDEPVQIKRTSLKKRLNLSDDESDNILDKTVNASNLKDEDDDQEKSGQSSVEEPQEQNKSPKTKKKKQKRVLMSSDSDESDVDDPRERSSSRNSASAENPEDHGATQRKILESLRSDNGYDAESSEEEAPDSGRYSGMSNHSQEENSLGSKKSKSGKPKPPSRKSAVACRAAMQKERLKMVSESQRMVRESQASLPYHKPRQRSLKEFLSARLKPSPLLRGAKFQQVDITAMGQELEQQEKLVEEFYKPASDASDNEEQERFTPPPPHTPEPQTEEDSATPGSAAPVEDRILRVLLATADELAKNIEANKDLGPKVEESSVTKEQNTDVSLDSTEKPVLDSAVNTICIKETVCENVDGKADSGEVEVPDCSDRKMESDTELMDLTASKDEEEQTKTMPESVDSNVATCSSDSVQTCTDQSISDESSKTELIPSLKPFRSLKRNVSTESSNACLTPSDAIVENVIFIKPAAKTGEDLKSKESSTEDTDEFHLFFEDSDDVLKNSNETAKNTDTSEIKTTAEIKPSPGKIVNKTDEFNLAKLYNSNDIYSSEEEDNVKAKEQPKGKARILANLKMKSGPVHLMGRKGEVIDLDEDVSLEDRAGVDDLMQRFIRQANTGSKRKAPLQDALLQLLQDGEQLEDTTDHKARPGAKMNLLKTELRHSIAKQRDQEFKRRQKEYQMYEDEAGGLLGDDEEGKVLSDDNEEMAVEREEEEGEGEESEGSTETEPELEDDVELRDTKRPNLEFLDAEAEVSDQEEEPAAVEQEEGEEGEEDEEEEEKESESDEEDDDPPAGDCEEDAEEDKEQITLLGGKKTFQRIKRVEDSDDEVDPADNPGSVAALVKNTILETQSDLQDEDDEKDKSYNSSSFNKSFNLSLLETSASDSDLRNKDKSLPNLGDLCGSTQRESVTETKERRMPQGITQLIEESRSSMDLPGIDCNETQKSNKMARGFPKSISDLFRSTDSLIADNIGDLCSGQFITQAPSSVLPPRGLNRLVQSTEDSLLPEDLGAICSGQFVTQTSQGMSKELNKLIGDSNTQTGNLSELCSGQFITQVDTENTQGMSKELNRLVADSDSVAVDLAELCSGQFITQAETQNARGMSTELSKLIRGSKPEDEDLAELCSGQFLTQAASQLQGGCPKDSQDVTEPEDKHEPDLEPLGVCGRMDMRIVDTSDEEDAEPDIGPATNSRQRKRKLAFSDDEDDGEEEEKDNESESEGESNDEGEGLAEEGGYVDYDSEENEVVVGSSSRARQAQFVDAEAELSGESEWGSADEDEGGMDQLEEELGDQEKFDEQEVEDQLKKIHARRMLDEDKNDVRLFQEAFLEDGDLHSEGGGRQRLFKWKNTDDGSWTEGANPNFSGDEGGEDDEEEEGAWRSARLERETWLLQNKDKAAAEEEVEGDSGQLMQIGRSLLAKMGSSRAKATVSKPASGAKPDAKQGAKQGPKKGPMGQSPGKAILHSLQSKSGSFLARRSISMTRMVALSGVDGESNTVVSATSRNFVFSSISPSTARAAAEAQEATAQQQERRPAPLKKRAATSKPTAAAPAIKKKRVSSSVFQLMQ